jgi:tartrate-resistant acid phosphatase type 5
MSRVVTGVLVALLLLSGGLVGAQTAPDPWFADVPPAHPFYPYVQPAAEQGLISGYDCGGPGEPCDDQARPYFRPSDVMTRAQVVKVVMLATGRLPPLPTPTATATATAIPTETATPTATSTPTAPPTPTATSTPSSTATNSPTATPSATATRTATATPAPAQAVTFATLGDFGDGTAKEAAVAALIASWNPDAVVTLGDNNYEDGAASTIDAHIGQFYHSFIAPYTGSYGAGSARGNRFWPALGNHDWQCSGCAAPYTNYFTLPGNERYYTTTLGPVDLFVLDSDSHEPDGITSTSRQALWLKAALAASTAPWKVVAFHHSPYTSGTTDGPTAALRWPFQAWGASWVMSAHEHNYERLSKADPGRTTPVMPYTVNGLGGCDQCLYPFGNPVAGSLVRFTGQYGAQKCAATVSTLTCSLVTIDGQTVDTFTLTR